MVQQLPFHEFESFVRRKLLYHVIPAGGEVVVNHHIRPHSQKPFRESASYEARTARNHHSFAANILHSLIPHTVRSIGIKCFLRLPEFPSGERHNPSGTPTSPLSRRSPSLRPCILRKACLSRL